MPGEQDNVRRLPDNKMMPSDIEGRTRPPESDEMRATMPKPASVVVQFPHVAALDADSDGDAEGDSKEFEGGLVAGPKHIGARRGIDRVRANDQLQQQG